MGNHCRVRPFGKECLIFCVFLLLDGSMKAQQNTVTAHVEIKSGPAAKPEKTSVDQTDGSDAVIWLKTVGQPGEVAGTVEPARKKPQLVQKDKSFQPHLLVVPIGSVVDFPNRDPFFHNVFSLFDGKRFDLGLYESGATNSVRFDRAGVSFLFCNIHPEMSAIVVAVDTPYYGVSDHSGRVTIANVPDGKYQLHLWYERGLPDEMKSLTRVVSISATTKDLGTIAVPENPSFSPSHKNKYGQNYTPPPTPTYSHP